MLNSIHHLNEPSGQSDVPYMADKPIDALQSRPELDEAAYHGIAGTIVKTIEPHSEADPGGLLLQTLAMAGNAIGRGPYYQVESDRHYPNLFIVLVGDSSKGRKGTSASRIRAVMQHVDEPWITDRVKNGLSSGEGLIYQVRDPVEQFDPKSQSFSVIDPGARDKRLMIVEPEFASALRVAERSGNNLSPLIRQAWDGDKLSTLTKNSPLCATGAHISIIGHITTQELRARISRTDIANGFANRFIFALVRRSKKLAFGGNLDDAELLHLAVQLKAPVCEAKTIGRVGMTEQARVHWRELYEILSEGQDGLLGAVTARAEAQVIRLALIYALLDGQDAIDVCHLKASAAVWEYAESSAAHTFGTVLGDPIADTILSKLRERSDGLSRNELMDLFKRHQTSDRIAAALTLLANRGLAKSMHHETGGRAAEIWTYTGK
jgi:Protein of unknown function (DUF3987)